MVIMASGIARGRVRTTTSTAAELPKIMGGGHAPNNGLRGTCSLFLPCTSLIFDICIVVNNKCVTVTNGFKLCSLISVNTHVRSKSMAKIEQL